MIDDHRNFGSIGRRSRRNSLTDDSQLTIENFGGSQDHLNLIGRLDKEQRERKVSVTAMAEPAVAVRSSLQDARSSLQIGYDMDAEQPEKQDRETEKLMGGGGGAGMRRQLSVENVSQSRAAAAMMAVTGEEELMSVNKKTTTFAALPNTTTWQQQSEHTLKHDLTGK